MTKKERFGARDVTDLKVASRRRRTRANSERDFKALETRVVDSSRGLVRRPYLNSVPHYNMFDKGATSACFGHDYYTGVVRHDLRMLFLLWINLGWTTVRELTSLINSFSDHLVGPDRDKYFMNLELSGGKTLHISGNMSQTKAALQVLPLALEPLLEQNEGMRHHASWNLLCEMVKLSALLSSVALTDTQVCEMQDVIEEYLNTRIAVARDIDGVDADGLEEPGVMGAENVLKPKHVVLLEYPSLVRQLGPLSFYATFAAESKNGAMKEYMRSHGSYAYPLSSLKTHVESIENRDVLAGSEFEYRFMDSPYTDLPSGALETLSASFGGKPPVASRCYHFTLHGSKYLPGSVVAFNERKDPRCETFNMGEIVALWGDDEESAGFLVRRLRKRLDKTFMVLLVRPEELYEVVVPEQLCCHEPYHPMRLPEPLGMVCALTCAPTVFGRLADLMGSVEDDS